MLGGVRVHFGGRDIYSTVSSRVLRWLRLTYRQSKVPSTVVRGHEMLAYRRAPGRMQHLDLEDDRALRFS